MDLVTQGILGAAVGQVGFQQKLGRKAIVIGAVAGLLPDLDILVRFLPDICAEMLYHRGFTHSLFFAPLFAPIAGWVSANRNNYAQLNEWISLWFWCLITHPLLDLFTDYGTQLLLPFSNYRFSLKAIPIIDPVYSLPLLVSVIIGYRCRVRIKLAQVIAKSALFLTTCYLFMGLLVHDQTLSFLNKTEPQAMRKESFSTMFSIFYRRLVIEEHNQYRVAYLHFFDLGKKPIVWHTLPKVQISDQMQSLREVRIFTWFADSWIIAENSADATYIKDLRFGMDELSLKGIWGLKIVNNQISWVKFESKITIDRLKNMLENF
jgi:inner membrane protein